MEVPLPAGYFIIDRPYATFYSPAWFNINSDDPYTQLEQVTMDKGDILLATTVKGGASYGNNRDT